MPPLPPLRLSLSTDHRIDLKENKVKGCELSTSHAAVETDTKGIASKYRVHAT